MRGLKLMNAVKELVAQIFWVVIKRLANIMKRLAIA
jgi:hypothetical protein